MCLEMKEAVQKVELVFRPLGIWRTNRAPKWACMICMMRGVPVVPFKPPSKRVPRLAKKTPPTDNSHNMGLC